MIVVLHGQWQTVDSVGPDEKQMERMFRRLWSLKEVNPDCRHIIM